MDRGIRGESVARRAGAPRASAGSARRLLPAALGVCCALLAWPASARARQPVQQGVQQGDAPPAARRVLEAPPAPAPPAEDEAAFSTLAAYTFDERADDSGPDTFRVFERARGRVTRTTLFRLSGEYSLELRDVAGNGDFPELMGFFDLRTSGQLYAHFAFLVVDPKQELNIAFVGPRAFRMEKDGFAVWLQSRDGVLRHVSDSIPKKLFEVQPFTWYLVDVLYDIDRGTYQLLIEEEGAVEPLVELADQPNATSQPGSSVDKFSFVSDPFEDRSEVVYYVDDIVLGADEHIEPRRFVAPGRRKLFVEMQVDAMAEKVRATREAGEEFPDDRWYLAMVGRRFAEAYREARGRLAELRPELEEAEPELRARVLSYWLERAADAALLDGNPALALQLYDEALAESGGLPGQYQLLKRADAHHLLNDPATEKVLREAIYGTLDPVGPDAPR
jgi:hypothetical protein